MQKIKVGIIGFGTSGRVFHAPLLKSIDGYEITKIYTRNEANIKFANEHYPEAVVVDKASEITTDSETHLVILATPNELHYTLGKEAMLSGKHVVIEKPFVIDCQEGRKLIEIAKKENRVLSVYHNRRFDSDFKTIKKLIDDGDFGKVLQYEASFNRFRPNLKNNWREEKVKGAGLLYDLGPHLIDQALDLFGTPEKLFADIRTQREIAKVDDFFRIDMFYGEKLNNLKVTLEAGMLVRDKTPKFRVIGTEGTFVKYGLDVQEAALKEGKIPCEENMWGVEGTELWGKFYGNEEGKDRVIESLSGDYLEYYSNIYDAIVNNGELAVKAQEALDVIKIMELAIESSEEKKIIEL